MADALDKFIKFGNADDEVAFGEGWEKVDIRNPNEVFSVDDGYVTPDVGPRKREGGKPIAVVIDDDYPTLDIFKIFLARDYECVTFSDPKEAIFYMNTHVPDVIFLDCYMTMISTQQILSILATYKEMDNVPVYFLVNEEEVEAIESKKYERIQGMLKRPVARGDLQEILDALMHKYAEND